jgi:hypothetical protein
MGNQAIRHTRALQRAQGLRVIKIPSREEKLHVGGELYGARGRGGYAAIKHSSVGLSTRLLAGWMGNRHRPALSRRRATTTACCNCLARRSASSGPPMRDIVTIDSELRLVAAFRRAARERGGPLPLIDVVDVLLDERRELTAKEARGHRE